MMRSESMYQQPFGDMIASQARQARSRSATLDQQLRLLVKERPVAAVLVAVGVGFFLARLASRW